MAKNKNPSIVRVSFLPVYLQYFLGSWRTVSKFWNSKSCFCCKWKLGFQKFDPPKLLKSIFTCLWLRLREINVSNLTHWCQKTLLIHFLFSKNDTLQEYEPGSQLSKVQTMNSIKTKDSLEFEICKSCFKSNFGCLDHCIFSKEACLVAYAVAL